MRIIYVGSLASLVNKRSEESLVNAIRKIIKKDEVFVPWYNYIRRSVKQFFVQHCDLSILDALIEKLSQVVA